METELLEMVDVLLREQAQRSPDPLGGAAIVVRPGGLVVGVGYDHRPEHAGAKALFRARHHAKGATLYVTAECPTCRLGATNAGIAEVIVRPHSVLQPTPAAG